MFDAEHEHRPIAIGQPVDRVAYTVSAIRRLEAIYDGWSGRILAQQTRIRDGGLAEPTGDTLVLEMIQCPPPGRGVQVDADGVSHRPRLTLFPQSEKKALHDFFSRLRRAHIAIDKPAQSVVVGVKECLKGSRIARSCPRQQLSISMLRRMLVMRWNDRMVARGKGHEA